MMTKDEIKKSLECCFETACRNCSYLGSPRCNDTICKDALNLITEQEQEIEKLKAEFKQLETNAEILARGVRDLNHENYELTEKIKQAKIDVLNELKKKIHNTRLNDDTAEIIIEMIEELQNAEDNS